MGWQLSKSLGAHFLDGAYILHSSTFSFPVMVSLKKTAEKRKDTLFSFGTWNVQGLSAKEKTEQLSRDCRTYNLDLVCIQETKITHYDDITLTTGH